MRSIILAAAVCGAVLPAPAFAQTAAPQPAPDLVLKPLGGLIPAPPAFSGPNRAVGRMTGASEAPMPSPMPPKGAEFSLRRGPTDIRVRCGENEPVKACADAALMLMDKFAVMTPQPPAPPEDAPAPPAAGTE